MNPALLYLLRHSFANAVLVRVKRLRQPKYLLGAIFGGAYFYFYFYRFLFRGGLSHPGPTQAADDALVLSQDVRVNLVALVLLVAVLLVAWIIPSDRAAISFTESEVAWLFPSPLSREQLIRFKLLKSQIGLLIFAILMTLMTGRLARDGHAWQHTFGWWVIFATLQMHRVGASFALTRLLDRGLSPWWRRLLMLGLMAAVGGGLFAWSSTVPSLPPLAELVQPGTFGRYLGDFASSSAAAVFLTPFKAVVQPWFARDGTEFLLALGPALLIVAGHYIWVTRSHVAFEEASVQLAERRAAIIAAQKEGNFRFHVKSRSQQQAIFKLKPTGWPAVAFVWKSWIRYGGRRAFGLVAFIALACLVAVILPALFPIGESVALVGTVVGGSVVFALLFTGPQMTALALRRELQTIEWLKASPVPAWQIVLGQLLGPSLLWAALQWIGLLILILGASNMVMPPLPLDDPLSWLPTVLLSAALVLPTFNIVSSLVPAGVMLIFPGWFKPGEMRGVEAAGLGIVMVVAQVVVLAVALIPAALAFVGVAFAIQLVLPVKIAIVAGSVFASTTLALESWVGSLALGGVLSRFDASSER